jgi:hypothetical protein
VHGSARVVEVPFITIRVPEDRHGYAEAERKLADKAKKKKPAKS